jgi:DNA-binding LacI/PurR family transcriptional regulator
MSNPTIKDVAEEAGVSISAVSLYLNAKPGVSKATQERIATAIRQLGYVPRSDSRREQEDIFIGLMVEKLPLSLRSDHFYADVAAGIQSEVENLGYHLVISILNQPQPILPRLITKGGVAGVIAVGGGDVTDDLLHQIEDNGTPLVTVDNYSASRHLNSILVDSVSGAYRATQHLIELGHRRIAIIRGPEKYKTLTERYQGYRLALSEAGLEPLVQSPLSRGTPRKGYLEMQQLLSLKERPTAVFAVTDRTALGAMDAIREHGLRVPDDISIVGFDDINPEAYSPPALTTVSSARFDMGVVAAQRLTALIQNPDTVPVRTVMYTSLVIRESSSVPQLVAQY